MNNINVVRLEVMKILNVTNKIMIVKKKCLNNKDSLCLKWLLKLNKIINLILLLQAINNKDNYFNSVIKH